MAQALHGKRKIFRVPAPATVLVLVQAHKSMKVALLDSVCARMDKAKSESMSGRLPQQFLLTVISGLSTDTSLAWVTVDTIRNHYRRKWKGQKSNAAAVISLDIQLESNLTDENRGRVDDDDSLPIGAAVNATPNHRNRGGRPVGTTKAKAHDDMVKKENAKNLIAQRYAKLKDQCSADGIRAPSRSME